MDVSRTECGIIPSPGRHDNSGQKEKETVSSELRFSVLVLPNVPWPELLRRCHEVEELGFDSIGLADHLVDWAGGKGPWFELWTHVAAVAQATSRIRLTTLVAQIPLRNPAHFAQQALTVDHISGGRLDVGLGTGLVIDPSYRMMGIENWSTRERVARFGEYVEIVDRLLSQEETTFKGRFYEVDGAALRPRPVQSPRPPIMIAAMGPVMLRHTARHADIWNSISFAKTFEEQLEETRGRVAALDARCAEIGRDPATLRRSYLMFDAAARQSGGRVNYYDSEEAFARMVEQVIALGITEIALYYPIAEEQKPVFERIARNVLPAMKAAHK
jgi:alkanesulfonate monooxygenase SsuD/methylene tetrahydromethanopterin reductase-like flavin-dependent oxidoreductase (luciferase family)